MVGLPAEFADRYPESLSGGQKQRVNLARALAAEPELILCDEVTSSLDAIVGASIVELLKSLRESTGASYLFISHDLPTVASFATRIVVLYAGRMVESGTVAEVLRPPFHPYTRLLLSSVPQLRRGWLEEVKSTTEARSSLGRPVAIAAPGCPFYDRCPLAIDGTCNVTFPEYHRVGQVHRIACHRSIDELDVAMSCREARH
jgi:peptide/nickel transport system ATP-binding protein